MRSPSSHSDASVGVGGLRDRRGISLRGLLDGDEWFCEGGYPFMVIFCVADGLRVDVVDDDVGGEEVMFETTEETVERSTGRVVSCCEVITSQ